MLMTLGIDSGVGVVQGGITAIMDAARIRRRVATSLAVGIMACFACIMFSFGFGIYVLELLDQLTVNWTLLVVASMECVVVGWSYGLAKIAYDVKLMTGKKPNMFILLCWKYITPFVIALMFIGTMTQFFLEITHDGGIYYTTFDPKDSTDSSGEIKRHLPVHAIVVAFLLMFVCMAWLPIHAILRKTKYAKYTIQEEGPGDFPEEELRVERNISVTREEEQFTPMERKILGKKSIYGLQKQRDNVKRTKRKSNDPSTLTLTSESDDHQL